MIKSSIHMFDIFKLRISLILHYYVHLENTKITAFILVYISHLLIEMPVPGQGCERLCIWVRSIESASFYDFYY